MTDLSFEEYFNTHGKAIIGGSIKCQIGQILPFIIDYNKGKQINQPYARRYGQCPLVVVREATKEEYLAQGVKGKGPYFYEVRTD